MNEGSYPQLWDWVWITFFLGGEYEGAEFLFLARAVRCCASALRLRVAYVPLIAACLADRLRAGLRPIVLSGRHPRCGALVAR